MEAELSAPPAVRGITKSREDLTGDVQKMMAKRAMRDAEEGGGGEPAVTAGKVSKGDKGQPSWEEGEYSKS